MIVHFSAHISKWELVCKFGVIFHIFIISCLCTKPVIFLICNNLFIYQVLCTLIYRRHSLYSFLPNTVVSWAPIGEWIVSNCFMTCCKIWQSLFSTKKCVIFTTELAWSQYGLSKVTWYENKFGMASTPALLYEVSLFQKSRRQIACPTQEAKCVMMHTATIADCTHGKGAKNIFVSNTQYLNYNEQ